MAVANSAGLPIAVYIADGPRFESKLVEQTIDASFVKFFPRKLIGDKAYDSRPLEKQLKRRRIQLIAPKRRGIRTGDRKQDGRALRRYKRRWRIEALFARLKRFRRISSRWDYKAENFLGFLLLGCIKIILRYF